MKKIKIIMMLFVILLWVLSCDDTTNYNTKSTYDETEITYTVRKANSENLGKISFYVECHTNYGNICLETYINDYDWVLQSHVDSDYIKVINLSTCYDLEIEIYYHQRIITKIVKYGESSIINW